MPECDDFVEARAPHRLPGGRREVRDPGQHVAEMKAEDGTNDGVADSLSEVLDPLGLARLAGDVFFGMAAHPGSLIATQLRLATAFVGIAGRAARGEGSDEHGVAPAPHDARFRHPAWSENPTLEALKDGYLLAVRTLLDAIDRADGLDDATRARLRFFAQQLCDALSPTNVPFLNPAVLEEAVASGGASLRRGLAHLLEDARDNGGRPPLVDRTKFAVGESVATSKGAVVYRNALIELIQYAPLTPSVHARPLLIVPPWINKFYVLDLRPENSFIAYAVERGFTVFAISWRNPDASLRHLTWDDYLELGPLYAARVASSITGSIDVNLIGYCIGGTLSATLLAYLAKTRERLIHATTFFASLSDFEDAGDIKAFLSESSLASIEAKMERDGVLSAADMSATFNLLRSNDLIWNVAVNRYLLGKEPPAFDLLFWNDDATRMPQAMHSWYLRNMYRDNKLREPRALSVLGVPLDLRAVLNDIYVLASVDDHIAPWRSVFRTTNLMRGKAEFRLSFSGHIAGIVNPPGARKGHYWQGPRHRGQTAEAWFAEAERREGSWWPDWSGWLQARSGPQVPAPRRLGSRRFPTLAKAPGTYVLERS